MPDRFARVSPVHGLIAAALVLHILPFVTRPDLIGGDEAHYALAAHSLATDLDLDLTDDYRAVAEGAPIAGGKLAGQDLDRHLISVNDRMVFAHPIGLPLIAAPGVALWNAAAPGLPPDLLLGLLSLAVTFAALIAGWRLLRDATGCGTLASWLAFGVYFSSPLWYYSRTFFTEPFTWAFAVLAIRALARRRNLLAALFLALTLAMKETALLLVLPILLGALALRGVGAVIAAAAGPALVGVAFMGKNLLLTGQLLTTFQPFRYGDLRSGAWGLLFDPAHGLFWFAPLLGVATIGWLLRPIDRRQAWLSACSAIAVAGYFALTAAWIDWRGGSCYATRLLLPVLPALAVPLLFLTGALPRKWSLPLLASLAGPGFAINFCAAIDPFSAFWNASAAGLVADHPLAFTAALAMAAAMLLRAQRTSSHDPRHGDPAQD